METGHESVLAQVRSSNTGERMNASYTGPLWNKCTQAKDFHVGRVRGGNWSVLRHMRRRETVKREGLSEIGEAF